MKRRFSLSEILIAIAVALILLIAFSLLALWTRYLSAEEQSEMLRTVLRSVIEEKGEKGLLEMAGVPVDYIRYSGEDLPLFIGSEPSWQYTGEEARSIAVYEKAKESVVQIISSSEFSDSGQGSGVIVSSDGYIVTNKHVLGSGSAFNVNFYDQSTSQAVLVGYDALSDIAVLKTDRTGLKAIGIGSSGNLVVGQTVLAIGNPFGYTWSLTSGMISGLSRMVFNSSGSVLPNMIQTDALINPGNSGGPLLDGKGNMVALVSSIYSTSGTAQGISFALPVETVSTIAKSIIENGKVQRGWLDILSVELNPQIVSYLSLGIDKGILISQVVPLGMADKAGLKGGSEKAQYGQSVIYLGGDVITAINGRSIESYSDYYAAMFGTKAGDKVDITVYRKGGYTVIKDVVLVEQNEENSRWIIR